MRATVLVPTHRHAETLPHAVGSALAQTITDLEVFIVGDGVDDATRAAALALAAADPRVRFFDFPKRPRHGELSRHEALAEARGDLISYLSDDDLYYPDHLETVAARLEHADFAQAMALFIQPDGEVFAEVGTPLEPGFRVIMTLEARNVVPLSGGAHTRDLYRRLPFGWRTSPDDVWTDLHMWRQIFSVEGIRVELCDHPTVVVFPTLQREATSGRDRAAEIASWVPLLVDDAHRRRCEHAFLRSAFHNAAHIEAVLADQLRVAAHAARTPQPQPQPQPAPEPVRGRPLICRLWPTKRRSDS